MKAKKKFNLGMFLKKVVPRVCKRCGTGFWQEKRRTSCPWCGEKAR